MKELIELYEDYIEQIINEYEDQIYEYGLDPLGESNTRFLMRTKIEDLKKRL